MTTILGIDAAWTSAQPSGLAVVVSDRGGWRCAAVAPSYATFLALAQGVPVDWLRRNFSGGVPNVGALLGAAAQLAGANVDLVAIDMPVSTSPINGRRAADDAVSREFGGRWCSTHTPNRLRPGALGKRLSKDFGSAGYRLATASGATHRKSLIEVYPHPALLSLLRRKQRVPYKISKAHRYWPGQTTSWRIREILRQFVTIRHALAAEFGPTAVPLPAARRVTSLAALKRYEDALDGLVCAWVGAKHIAGATVPLGDSFSAIWCPRDVVRERRPHG